MLSPRECLTSVAGTVHPQCIQTLPIAEAKEISRKGGCSIGTKQGQLALGKLLRTQISEPMNREKTKRCTDLLNTIVQVSNTAKYLDGNWANRIRAKV